MITDALTILVVIAAGFYLGRISGITLGQKQGRDRQWLDDYFALIERDKQRRDEAGRFKSKATK